MGWEKGFFEVDLSQVRSPDLDPDWKKAHGYTRAQVDAWTRQLGEIQSMSVNQGYTYEHFQKLRSSQVPAERELGETHHKFYDHVHQAGNHDFVSLTWNGSEYQINNNGRHRVSSAKEFGLRRMPAEVTAQSEHMAQRKQEGYASQLLHPNDRAEFVGRQYQSPQQTSFPSSTTSPSTPTRTSPGGTSGTPSGRVRR